MCYPLHGAFEFGFDIDVCYGLFVFQGIGGSQPFSVHEVIMIDDRVVSRCASMDREQRFGRYVRISLV